MRLFILSLSLLPFLSNAQEESTIDTLIINCDSIYSKKGLSISHIINKKENQDGYSGEKNSVFIFRKTEKEIFRDSIFSTVQEINFKDFNNDNVKDILVQNTSDVRSNWTYVLYLVNPKDYTLTKVKGFDEIKNPTYNAQYDIVEGSAVSGRDYTSFYKIIKNRIYDYEVIIYDDHGEDDNYNKAYSKALKEILRKNKNLPKK